MSHLTVDEILEYISVCEYNDQTLRRVAAVNTHIRTCPSCLKQVRAYQILFDEFQSLCIQGSFQEFVAQSEREQLCAFTDESDDIYGKR